MTRTNPKRFAWSIAALVVASAPVHAAGVAHRVADLRTTPTLSEPGHSEMFGTVGSDALLSLQSPGLGWEPWISDGTAAGTRLLLNVAAGSDSALPGFLGELPNGRALFSAYSIERGRELWATDGTAAGTGSIHEFAPGIDGAEIAPLGRLGGRLLLAVEHQEGSLEIWSSDGTPPGTSLVRKIQQPTLSYRYPVYPPDSATLGGRLYFAAADVTTGLELWASDGTDGGTYRVADLWAGSESSAPHRFVGDGTRIGFQTVLGAPTWGLEAWIVDAGSPAPRSVPLPIARDNAGVVGRVPGGLVVWSRGGGLDRLWFTDGTPGGAVELRQLESDPMEETFARQVGERVVFRDFDPATGSELWVTDGTPAGTTLLRDLVPGPGSSQAGPPTPGHAGGAFFCEGTAGTVWRTDGTTAGTAAVFSPPLGCDALRGSSVLGGLTVLDVCRTVLVPPHDEEERCATYRTNGTAAGTWTLRPPISLSSSNPQGLTPRAGGLVFAARLDTGVSPYFLRALATDGSAAGTVELSLDNGDPVDTSGEIAALADGSVLLVDRIGDTERLLRVEGSEGVPIFASTESVAWLLPVADVAFFSASDTAGGIELWSTDGTAPGTGLVRDLEPGPESSYPLYLTDVFGRLFFAAGTSLHGEELWESDGSMAGTFPHDFLAGPASTFGFSLSSLTPFREDFGLLAVQGEPGVFLIDPVEEEATLLLPAPEDGSFSLRAVGVNAGARLLTWIDENLGGVCILRSSDGTPGGTVRLHDMAPERDAFPEGTGCHGELAVAGALAYFTACDEAAGCELWSTDGTVAGTARFADLEPGPASFVPHGLAVVGDRLYFAGCRQATGCEPWISDFTLAGTHPLADIAPGAASSDARDFARSDPWVYFVADDGTGAELWAVPIEIFYDGFQTGDTSRWSLAP